MNSRHLHELIDACRPGHDDVDQPEFSELAQELSLDPSLQRLFARSQEVDSTIRATFQNVTPPPGFAERLLEALESAAAADDVEGTRPVVTKTEACIEPARRPARRSLAIMAGLASISAVAAAIMIWLTLPQPLTTPTDHVIAENIDRWNAGLDEANWQTVANLPAQDFPTWQHLKIGRDDRWQWVSKRRIVCYDFAIKPREDGEIVRLFVSKPTSAGSLTAIPPAGYPSPLGWHVGAWQTNGRVYYLAVYAERDSKSLYSRVIGSRMNPA